MAKKMSDKELREKTKHRNFTSMAQRRRWLALHEQIEKNRKLTDWMDGKLNSSRENLGISSQYGPVKFLNDVAYPENPFQLMNSRFQLFFETVLA